MATPTKTARSRRTRAALTASVRDRLCAQGGFTAEEVAGDAGCTVGTFWAHFSTKDDAVAAAFEQALDDLILVVEVTFSEPPADNSNAWAAATVDRLVDYFATNALLYRLAIARLPEHRPIRDAYRTAEHRTIDLAEAALAGPDRRADAEAIISFCQGLNNPIVLRSEPGGRLRVRLARALGVLVGDAD